MNRGNGIVSGTKSFNYFGIPNEPGSFELGDYFSWIYFNTSKDDYDTLRSEIQLIVTGESKKNQYILSNDLGTFYDTIELQDNELYDLNENRTIQAAANILILILLMVSAIFMFKK